MRRLPCSLRLSAWLLDSSPRVLRRRQQSYEGTVAGKGETKEATQIALVAPVESY